MVSELESVHVRPSYVHIWSQCACMRAHRGLAWHSWAFWSMSKSFQVILGRCAKMRKLLTDRQTDRQTDRPTDRPTDQGQVMSRWSRLKTIIPSNMLHSLKLGYKLFTLSGGAIASNRVVLFSQSSRIIITHPYIRIKFNIDHIWVMTIPPGSQDCKVAH